MQIRPGSPSSVSLSFRSRFDRLLQDREDLPIEKIEDVENNQQRQALSSDSVSPDPTSLQLLHLPAGPSGPRRRWLFLGHCWFLAFLPRPAWHRPASTLNRRMLNSARSASGISHDGRYLQTSHGLGPQRNTQRHEPTDVMNEEPKNGSSTLTSNTKRCFPRALRLYPRRQEFWPRQSEARRFGRAKPQLVTAHIDLSPNRKGPKARQEFGALALRSTIDMRDLKRCAPKVLVHRSPPLIGSIITVDGHVFHRARQAEQPADEVPIADSRRVITRASPSKVQCDEAHVNVSIGAAAIADLAPNRRT